MKPLFGRVSILSENSQLSVTYGLESRLKSRIENRLQKVNWLFTYFLKPKLKYPVKD
jgi:hypothetical protein